MLEVIWPPLTVFLATLVTDEIRAITSPYFKYPKLVVDGRPIDVFLPEFLRPAFVNTLIAFWVLVVIGERAKKRKLER